MAETAMVVSFTLILLFGMVQLVVVGYLQVAGDAAVFLAAHEYTLGVPQTTIATAESSMVPKSIASAVTYTPAPPNPVGSTLFNEIYGTLTTTNRNGGYTLVRPQNFTVYLNSTSAYSGGIPGFNSLPISSAAVEGYYLMTNQQMNNFGTSPDDPTALTGNILDPANASPFLPQSDAVVANMNTPPYYLPNPIIQVCGDPWAGGNPGAAFNTTCANPHVWFLGLGEFIEDSNYAPTSGAVGVGPTDAFATMSAHQRIYAKLIAAFPAIPGTLATQDGTLLTIKNQFNTSTGYGWYNTAIFPNGGVPLEWYDPMGYWESSSTRPSWYPRKLWGGEYAFSNNDAGGDGVYNTAGWAGASPALVYEWDQPNFPSAFIGPGTYPANPTAGTTVSGDPGYQP